MKGKSMHRKKFLSFLGMAVVAAPILAKEIPQANEVKPLALKDGSLGIGKLGMLSDVSNPVPVGVNAPSLKGAVTIGKINGIPVPGPYPSEGQILTYNSAFNSLSWENPVKWEWTSGIIHTTNKMQWQEVAPYEGVKVYHAKFIT